MLISTILLIANFAFLFFKEKALFSFRNFLWIYPAEIIVHIIGLIIFFLMAELIKSKLT